MFTFFKFKLDFLTVYFFESQPQQSNLFYIEVKRDVEPEIAKGSRCCMGH